MNVLLTLGLFIVFSLTIFVFAKLVTCIFDKIEKVVPTVIMLPLMFFAISKVVQFHIVPSIEEDELRFIPSLLMLFLLFSVAALVYLFEKTGHYMCQQQNIWRFFLYVILTITSLALVFACQYDLLYAYYEDSFDCVPDGSWIDIFIEFIIYSFGILFANSVSQIESISLYAKILSLIESIYSFILLVFFISYYKEIGELFHTSKRMKNTN